MDGILKRVLEINKTKLGKCGIRFKYQKWNGNIDNLSNNEKVKAVSQPTI